MPDAEAVYSYLEIREQQRLFVNAVLAAIELELVSVTPNQLAFLLTYKWKLTNVTTP